MRFLDMYRRLTPAQRERFLCARDMFLVDIRAGCGFRKGLPVKGVRTRPGVYEVTWAPDGRATFAYGPSKMADEPHITWLEVGPTRSFDVVGGW